MSRRLFLSIAGGTVILGGMLASKEYPYAPLLLLFILAPSLQRPSARHNIP